MDDNTQPVFANGKICYIEIPATDIEKSASFYKAVFGWIIRNDNAGNITFDDTTDQVSGMWVTGKKPASEPGLLVSIMVDSVAETLELINKNGGKPVPGDLPSDGPEVIAKFLDPAGNMFCLYQNGG